jgi:hypothetical protein
MLVCAAELLWELTFHEFSAECVRKEAESLNEISESIADDKEMISHEPFDLNTTDNIECEKILIGWLKNAPREVKQDISDHTQCRCNRP